MAARLDSPPPGDRLFLAMTDVPVHFAFPDGALRYDCAACDQRCCKTGGLPLFAAEREALLTRLPALELVAPVAEADARVSLFSTPKSGCWLLAEGGCTLMGQPLRPRACELFPFNLFGTLGGTLVVAPNGLCPLRLDPAATQGVRHADLAATLARLGTAGMPPAPLRPEGDAIVPLERLLLAATTAALDEPSFVPLVAFSELATAAFLARGGDGLDTLDLTPLPEAIAQGYARLERWSALTGLAPLDDAALAAVAATLGAWTPTLRLFAFDDQPLGRLPRILLALGLLLAHWQRLRPSRPLLPQTLQQMVPSLGPLATLLALWDEPWPGPALAAPTLAPGEVPATRFAAQLAAHADPHGRIDLLHRLAAALLAPGQPAPRSSR